MTNNTRIVSQRARTASAEIAEIVLMHIATGTGPCDAECFEQVIARFEEETLALSRDGERGALIRVRKMLFDEHAPMLAVGAFINEALATPKHTREAAQDGEAK